MGEHSGVPPESKSLGQRLDSWKGIAAYLGRHVTTVRRWEKQEGLPVHRHVHAKLGSIHAFSTEVDAWFEGRRATDAEVSEALSPEAAPTPERLPPPPLIAERFPCGIAFTGREREMERLDMAPGCAGQPQIVPSPEPGIESRV